MGLGDKIASTVTTIFKSKVDDHVKGVEKIQKAEEKLAKKSKKDFSQKNKQLDDQIKKWAKVGVAIGGATVAIAALKEGFDTYATNARLRAANVNTNLDGLRASTKGLVDDTRLLEFSAAAMNGTFKLTQEQTESVLKGALALRKTTGVDLPTAMQRLQQSITEGNIEPLKQLGIVMTDVKNNSMEATLAVVDKMKDEFNSLGGNVDIATDSIDRQATSFENSMDTVKENLGKIVVAMQPVIKAVADLAQVASGLFGKLDRVANRLAGIDVQTATRSEEKGRLTTRLVAARQGLFKARARRDRVQGDFGAAAGTADADRVAHFEREVQQLTQAIEGIEHGLAGERAELLMAQLPGMLRGARGALQGQFGGRAFDGSGKKDRRGRGGRGGGRSAAVSPFDGSQTDAHFAAMQERQAARAGALAESKAQFATDRSFDSPSLQFAEGDTVSTAEHLERAADAMTRMREQQVGEASIFATIFGTPEEITLGAAAIETYAQSFDVLASASGAAMGAFIDGSMGVAEAFRSAIADGLKAMAIDMSIKALREVATGTAMLFNPVTAPLAAGHFKAAGMFSVGAAAAAAGAITLGARGSTQTSRGAGGAGGGIGGTSFGAGGAGRAGPNRTFIVLDDGFDQLPAQQRRNMIRRRMRDGGFSFEADAVERK